VLRPGTVRAAASSTTAAPVTGMERRGDGWRVKAGGEAIDVAEVVDAAGAWADVVAGLAGVPPIGLTPYRRTIAVVRVPDPYRLHGPDGTRLPMVVDTPERFYFKQEGDGLLVSPADETPVEPHDVRPDELDVAMAVERAEAVTGLGLRSVRTAWAGLRSFVPDRLPVVGAWPEHPGFWFCAGQGGSGIETAPALAAFAAAVVTGGALPADVPLDRDAFTPARLCAGCGRRQVRSGSRPACRCPSVGRTQPVAHPPHPKAGPVTRKSGSCRRTVTRSDDIGLFWMLPLWSR
jgi:D-arginine dehydrogenase